MEKITTECSHCNVRMKVNENCIGRKAKCPQCSNFFVIQPIAQKENNKRTSTEAQKTSTLAPPQKKEDFLLSQKLRQDQQDILRYFRQIVEEYNSSEADAISEHLEETENLKQILDRRKRELEQKLESVSYKVENAKDSLKKHFERVVQDTSVPGSSRIKSDSSNPENDLSQCAYHAERILSEIKNLSGEPTPLAAIAATLFVCSWIFLGIAMRDIGSSFIFALFIASGISITIYDVRTKERAKPYGKLLQLKYDAERMYKLALGQLNKQITDRMDLIDKRYERTIQSIKRDFENKMLKVYQFCEQFKTRIDEYSPEWTDECWQNFSLSTTIPSITRIGELITGRWEVPNKQNLNKEVRERAVELENISIESSLLEIIPEEIAKKYKVIPIKIVGKNLTIAMADSDDIYSIIDDIQFITGYQIAWVPVSERAILDAIDLHYERVSSKTQKKEPDDYKFSMPALFPFPGDQAVLFKVNGQGKAIVAQQLQGLLLRLLATIPPAKLKFTFIDPVALGQNVAPFMHLADHDESLVTSKSWSEPKHIERRLEELTEHMETVIQKYLRNTYANIEEFNEQAGEVAEAYRFLVVLNFPVNFSEDAARRLVTIVQNGPRCGVHTIIVYDTDQKLPYGFNADDLERSSMVVNWDGSRLTWQESKDSSKCILELEEPPDDAIFKTIITEVGKAAIEASKVEVPFEKVLEKADLRPENWWKGNTVGGLRIPLGPIGANKVQYLDVGKGTAQHALIAGKTGSGKSTLLHVLISTLTLKYSPNEIQLYLIDFKKGVEFKVYAAHQLPHARVVAIESEREFGLSVLEGLDAELTRRGDLCRTEEVDSLQAYRRKTKRKMPRILLLVDEFQEFFTIDDPIASKTLQILDRLVRQGRAFGIHILLGSQTLAGTYTLSRSTIDQMAIRIALQCSEADSRLILNEDNPAARLLSRPGEAIYNSANGLIEGNNPFQVAWLDDEQQKAYLKKIQVLGKKTGHYPPKNQIIFEGNAPVKTSKNRAFISFLLKTKRASFLRKTSAWLGEPIAIKDATHAFFRRQSGSNLLIVGQNDEAAMGMLLTTILSISAQYNTESAQFYLLDFGNVDAPHAHFLNYLTDMLPHQTTYGRRRHLPDIINTLHQEVENRLAYEDEGLEKKPSIYLIIYGLQRARDLEKDDGFSSSFSAYSAPSNFTFGMPDENPDDSLSTPPAPPVNPGQQLPEILCEGPDVGIHTIVWCDTNTNLNRRLDRQMLREFEMRVVFQMSNEDSLNLIDSNAASKLGQHRALFYSEEEGRLEKFRPFALPSEKWLKKVGEQLKNKAEQ